MTTAIYVNHYARHQIGTQDCTATARHLNGTTAMETDVTKLNGKIALVTGASSGIGEATAQRLATAGYNVFGTSRRGAQAGRQAFEMLPLDVTSNDSVDAAVAELLRRESRIDLLVNNAGFGVAPAAAEESSFSASSA